MNDSLRRTPPLLVSALLVLTSACGEPVQFAVLQHDTGATGTPDAVATDSSVERDSSTEIPRPGTDTNDPETGPSADGATDAVEPSDSGSATDTSNPPPDLIKPVLRSAFSNKQGVVTARFSEPLGEGAQVLSNYGIKASNNQSLAITSVVQNAQAPQYVDLVVDQSAINSSLTYTLTVTNVSDLEGNTIALGQNKAKITRTLYLSIVWHQHQPLYLDPVTDELSGPWVRKHATKDYYDMTSILEEYPDVHVNVNLTTVLLRQLIEYYVERLDPYIDVFTNSMDVEGFKQAWSGRTDPWIDFLLQPTPSAETITEEELLLVWKGPWTLLSTADPTMKHFPEYIALRDANRAEYDKEDFLALKIWFEIAWFDPDFLNGPVTLPDGSVTRVHEWLDRTGDTYTLKVPPSEQLAIDLLIENHKIMRNTIPIHKKLFYDAAIGTGQVEVTTTPMYHPILPLIYDTDLMAQSQPFDPRPEPNYSAPGDAAAQVLRATRYYEDIFGVKPRGIWCGEGSVAEDIVPLLVDAGLEWTATDHEVLKKSMGDDNAPVFKPYAIDSGGAVGIDADNAMLIVFRETLLSDQMGFEYKTWKGQDAAQDFIDSLASLAPSLGGEDRLVTIVLDGENAWEQYTQEHDAKGFHHALYGKLSEAYETGEIVTVTTSEYIHGNPSRAIPAHPIAEQTELEPLWAGSWIGGTFSTWIGEQEENKAWGYLRQARTDLTASGLAQPNPLAAAPKDPSSLAYQIYKAFDFMYAAEGSDWFWWYGVDQTTPSNDDSPFDRAFRSQLLGMYTHMNAALELLGEPTIPVPDFAPLIQAKPQALEGPYNTAYPAPIVDGAFVPNETEWSPPGGFFFDSDSSTAISALDDINTVYYGYDADAFYIAIQANEDLSAKLGSSYAIALLVDHKNIVDAGTGVTASDPANPFTPPGEDFVGLQVARRVVADFASGNVELRIDEANGSGGWSSKTPSSGAQVGGPLFGGAVLEMKIPFVDLNLAGPTDPLNFYVTASEADNVIDAAPTLNARRVFDDVTNLVFVTFVVDCTGSQIPLDVLGLKNLPPPSGNGNVYIAGNHDKLGAWVPNKIALSDSGQSGDETTNDGQWSLTVGVARGEVLRYKYTVGTGTDEGQWPGTEEFPFTNRQYVVPVDPSVSTVIIRDVLGDDPPNENSLGNLTVVTEISE